MIHRIASLAVLTCAAVSFASLPFEGFAAEASQTPTRRPNIVFILADDLGINDLGCYGRKEHSTPNLDKLARQGMRFTTAYSAQSVCSPTRAAILTGKSPARLHLTTFLPGRPDSVAQMLLHPRIEPHLPRGEKILAQRLKTVGYKSACIGKWHLGGKDFLPTDFGFDLYHPGKAHTQPSATEGGNGEYDLTARAEKFIDDHKTEPFFLYLAHNNPHVPLAAKAELIEKHKKAFNPIYAAMIETLDDCVGRVIAKLDALGLGENTLVVFTSDNGGLHVLETPNTPATTNRPYRAGKGFVYEGGIRIPLIVRWTGKIKAGETASIPVISTDWTPTFLAVAGVPTADPFDGVNLLDLLQQGKAPPPRPLYWHQPHYTNQGGRPAGAIREGDWKLVEHYENGYCELFELAKDPGETKDVGASEAGRVADLRGKLEKWRRDVNAQSNGANPKFNGKYHRPLYEQPDVSSLPWEEPASRMALKMEKWRALMDEVVPPGSLKNPGEVVPGAGAFILPAREAKVHGGKLRFEPQPHKDTLGFWVQKDDWVEWTFDLPAAGVFEVELLCACGKGSGGAEVAIAVKDQKLTMKVAETGSFQRFVPRTVGTMIFDAPGSYTLSVRARTKPGGAVMDLRRVVLRAAP